MKFLPSRFILCILILVFIVPNNFAQENEDTLLLRKSKQLPILNGFRFMPTDVIRDPFMTTYFKFNLGAGTAIGLKSYIKNLQGNVVDTLSGDLTYISGKLEFQYAFNNWAAVYSSYGGSGRLGSNAYTILTSGISYLEGYALGGKIRIWQNEKMILSGNLEYSSRDVSLYSIYDFVKKVYETGYIDSTYTLLQTYNIPQVFLNLNYAFALTNYLGIQSSAGYGVGKAFQTDWKGNVSLGLAASIDLLNLDPINFPIGILGSVRYNTYSETGEDVNDLFTYGLRLAYTGHKDFDVGIESTYQSLQYLKFDQKVKTVLTEFKMMYYF